MNISGQPFLFQPNNIFAAKSPFGQIPGQGQGSVSDILSRVSDNIVNARERSKSLEDAARSREVRLDSYSAGVDASRMKSMEEMPDELLHFLRNQFLVRRNVSCRMEQELTAFRDGLMGLDQTIQEYQDILDGKTPLSGDLSMEDVTELLELTRAVREQFVQDNAERLNKWNMSKAVTGDGIISRAIENVLGENRYADMDASVWEIDASAGDIYAEIDEALSATRSVTDTMEEGYRRICGELEERGYTQWKYEEHLSAMRENNGPADVEKMDIRQLILEHMRRF